MRAYARACVRAVCVWPCAGLELWPSLIRNAQLLCKTSATLPQTSGVTFPGQACYYPTRSQYLFLTQSTRVCMQIPTIPCIGTTSAFHSQQQSETNQSSVTPVSMILWLVADAKVVSATYSYCIPAGLPFMSVFTQDQFSRSEDVALLILQWQSCHHCCHDDCGRAFLCRVLLPVELPVFWGEKNSV